MREFGRLITAMATPFQSDGSLDAEGAGRLALHLVETGTETVLVNGTTGESPVLTHLEKLSLLAAVKKAVGSRVPVMMGTGNNCTAESAALTKEAEQEGADGILLVAPYYNKPPQEGLYRHFKAVAEATTLPVMLYNVPPRTATDLLPETVIRLSRIPNIFGIKEASGHVNRAAEILAACEPGFLVYSGDDAATLPILALGGYGLVSVASHVAGRSLSQMIQMHFEGCSERAAEIDRRLLPLFRALFITTSPIPLKAALSMLDLPGGPVRLPLVEATAEEAAVVREALRLLNAGE